MPQTSIEKIAQKYASNLEAGWTVRAGDLISIRPAHVMTHDNTGAVIPKFLAIWKGAFGGKGTGGTPAPPRILDPSQPVFAIDHDVQNTTPDNLGKYAKIEAFAREQGVVYYPPGRGIAHQVMVEEGYVTPGSLVVGSDSHSNLYGAAGALGTPVVRTDAAAIWATGETWWQVPEQARVTLTGSLRNGATGKDVIITLCGFFNKDEALNCAVEFHGEGVRGLTMAERMTIANMTTEWGALIGMFPFDEVLRDYLLERADLFEKRGRATGKAPAYTRENVEWWWKNRAALAPDKDAYYARDFTLDLASVTPHVSGPNEVKTMAPVAVLAAKKVKINKAYLMSCVNARLEDLAAAAKVVGGKKVAPGVEFYLAAASSEVQQQAKALGYWDTLLGAGAIELPNGCGACIGLGRGTLVKGEVGISATNRNFEGRMGDRTALCYLASPAVVAASAVAGYICAPGETGGETTRGTFRVNPAPKRDAVKVTVRSDFPKVMRGRVLFLPKDNLNTDGIYGKDVTYRDDITLEQQGQYAMLNYDPKFQTIAQRGDIIVGARNFGSGSSREQAATCLASRGMRMVIAASFSETYKRNAFNNGFLCIDCPALTDELAARLAPPAKAGERTIVGPEVEVDFENSVIRLGASDEAPAKRFEFAPLGPVAQELVVVGGSEEVVKRRLAASASST